VFVFGGVQARQVGGGGGGGMAYRCACWERGEGGRLTRRNRREGGAKEQEGLALFARELTLGSERGARLMGSREGGGGGGRSNGDRVVKVVLSVVGIKWHRLARPGVPSSA